MKDKIVKQVRKIRQEIDSEIKGDWDKIEDYYKKKQISHKDKLYKGTPKKLPKRDVA